MRFVECVDYGDAGTDVITGVASISLIGPGTVEIVYYRNFEMPDGTMERRVAGRQVWDLVLWKAASAHFKEASLTVERQPYVGGGIAVVH